MVIQKVMKFADQELFYAYLDGKHAREDLDYTLTQVYREYSDDNIRKNFFSGYYEGILR